MMGGVFLQTLRTLEKLSWCIGLATPLLVFAVLLRKRRLASGLLVAAAMAVPLALACPAVATELGRFLEGSVRNTVKPGTEYDVAIVLSGEADTRLPPAVDLIRSRRARFILYSGRLAPADAKVIASNLRSHRIRDDEILFEQKSTNTHENAVESARMVRERRWKRIVLITGANHARRAVASFRKAGLSPDLLPVFHHWPSGLLPRWWAVDLSNAVMHESFGLVAYRLVGYAE
jgi:uncharacterized SAM-binding protein YcdF (DUF218 family)